MFRWKKAAAKPDMSSTVLRLSFFAFSRLSPSDQREKTEEIHSKLVDGAFIGLEKQEKESEEDFRLRTFEELFNKLPLPETNLFLSRITKKFIRERQFAELISSFRKLDADDQQQLIGTIVDVKEHEEADDEDSRVRRFTRLSRDYTDYVFKRLVTWQDAKKRKGIPETSDIEGTHEEIKASDQEVYPDWQCRFDEFFFGFSIIWFEGQSVDGQIGLIDKLSYYLGVKGGDITYQKRPNGSVKDSIRLARFTELCKKAIHFSDQVSFFNIVDKKLHEGTIVPQRNVRQRLDEELSQETSLPEGMILEPQDCVGAADLLLHLSSFGISLLSASGQRKMIRRLSYDAKGVVTTRLAEETEEGVRLRAFTELFNEVSVITRIHLFKDLRKKFSRERKLCEPILLFRQLSSIDQQNLFGQLFDRLLETFYSGPSYVEKVIIEILPEESEEDFRLRKFTKLCRAYPFLWKYFGRREAEKCNRKGILQTLGNEEIQEIKQSRFSEFFYGMSIIWFETRCADDPRNPIQLLIASSVEEGDFMIEKRPEETEENFRLRRFSETFKQLRISSQEYIVKYIQDTIIHDLGYPWAITGESRLFKYRIRLSKCHKVGARVESPETPEHLTGDTFDIESTVFTDEFIKVKTPNLKRGSAPTDQGGGATTQGGGGGGGGGGGVQGTSQQ